MTFSYAKKAFKFKVFRVKKSAKKGENLKMMLQRGQCLKFVPILLEVTAYRCVIVWSAEAHSIVTVHMRFSLSKSYTVEKKN